MSQKQVYRGTSGLNIQTAINRVYELLDKQALGGKDEEFYKEARQVIEQELKVLIKDSKAFNIVRTKLTPKQWEMIYDSE